MGAESSSKVEAGGVSFDLAGVLATVEQYLWLVLLLLAVAFVFFIFQKGGFAEKYLDSRNRKRELDAKQLENIRRIADTLSRQYEGEEPFLPLPDFTRREDGDK